MKTTKYNERVLNINSRRIFFFQGKNVIYIRTLQGQHIVCIMVDVEKGTESLNDKGFSGD